VKAKLTLTERTFTCEACGLVMDRDLNAACNLAKLMQSVAQSGWETSTARGADRKPQLAGQVAMKARSRHRASFGSDRHRRSARTGCLKRTHTFQVADRDQAAPALLAGFLVGPAWYLWVGRVLLGGTPARQL
jgi:hypothetical protein